MTDLSLHYLAKAKILVIKDVERDEIEFITKTLNCLPIANIEHFKEEKLGYADLVEEVSLGDGKIVKITGIEDIGRTTTVLVRGPNHLVLDEAERSLHDAFCVVRCLVSKRFLIAGGGARGVVKGASWDGRILCQVICRGPRGHSIHFSRECRIEPN